MVRTDRLGDVILTLPMLPALRSCFPDAHIAMLLRRYTGEVLEGNPYVDELIWYDRNSNPAQPSHGLIPFNEMCTVLRERKFDAAVVVYPRFRLAWLMFRAGIPLRIGTGYRLYSFLFNRRVYEHRKDAKRHEVEYNLNLLRELNCTLPNDFRPEFVVDVPAHAEEKVRQVLQAAGVADAPFAVIHPGSGGSAREWPTGNFGVLASRLNSELGLRVIVTGTKGEAGKIAEVVQASEGQAIALEESLSIKEFAALIRSAKIFLSNSTGPLHLAVAMGTPVIGLFPQHTAMSARRWGPYTEKKIVFVPDRPLDCNVCIENQTACECMATITVDQVFASAMSLLNRTRQGGAVHAD